MVQARISVELREKAVRMTEAHDISLSALVAELLERAEIDANGRLPGPLRVMPKRDSEPQLDLSA
jgi:hypothetical protein